MSEFVLIFQPPPPPTLARTSFVNGPLVKKNRTANQNADTAKITREKHRMQ